ncbi:MAG TPA: hypothetical protein VNM48_00465 [Chloroflexota bacterium]|nr:hypothetical protein [Chloroflexota bacterium]
MSYSTIQRDERRTRVARLLRLHYSEGKIAQEVGVSRSTICGDVKAIRAEYQALRQQDVDAVVNEELDRLAVMERAIWPKLEAGNLFAIDRQLAIMERRAKYLGLDVQPDAVLLSGPQVTVTILDSRDSIETGPRSLAATWRSLDALPAG